MDEAKKENEKTKSKGTAEETLKEFKFKNQNWIKVLNEIWEYAPYQYSLGNRGYEDSHPLAKKLKIKGDKLTLIMCFLVEQKLIEYDQQQHNRIEITSKGFDVALTNRAYASNLIVNRETILLTSALTIIAVVSLLVGINNNTERWAIGLLIGIGVAVVAVKVVNKIS